MTKPITASHRRGLFITLLTALAYSVWPSAMRAVYADGANTSFVIVVGMMLRSLPLLINALFTQKPLFQTRTDTRNAITGGFFQAFSSGAAFAAVHFLPGPLAIVILFSHTIMLLFFMIWRKEIKADAATVVATTSALIGLIFVLDLFHKQSSTNLLGMACAFVSAIAIASRLYVIGHQTKTRHPVVVGAENYLVAMLMTLTVLLWQIPHPPQTASGYAWLFFGCFTLGLGTLGQFYAIGLLGSFRYSLFLKLEPLFATVFAALLIHEYLQSIQYFGIVLVIGSLGLYQFIEHRRRNAYTEIMSTTNE